MKEHSEHLDDLIGKYLLGEATPAETGEVDAWVQLSEENRQYFQEMKTLLEKTAAPSSKQHFDATVAWNKVKAKIEAAPATKHEAKVIPISRKKFYYQIAASLAVAFFIAAILLSQFKNKLQTEHFLAGNEVLVDTLVDGTIIHLNKNSTLKASFNPATKLEQVELVGEAYFEINKPSEGEFLIVTTQGVLIRDIGTSFNVKAIDNTVEILVEEGEVQMYSDHNRGINILAGESGFYDVTAKTFTKAELLDKNALAYKTKKFRFNDTPLVEVVQSLNSVYDKKITLQGNITQCNITISFDNEDVTAIADLIAETLGLKKVDSPTGIILEGTGCGQ